jgi:hypothetical protein
MDLNKSYLYESSSESEYSSSSSDAESNDNPSEDPNYNLEQGLRRSLRTRKPVNR